MKTVRTCPADMENGTYYGIYPRDAGLHRN